MASRKDVSTLEKRRRETLSELESLLGRREIGADEYRRRAEVARRAHDETELESVREGPGESVPPARSPEAPVPRRPAPPTAPTAHDAADDVGFVFSIFGGSVRKGPWEPPETLYAISLFGGVELDFREAALLEGATEVVVVAIMGGAKIIVPDDVDVEVNGIGVMGGFEHVSQHLPGEGRPLIRIRGLALMGGVSIKVRPAGPSAVERLAKRVRDWV
jgi:hypothetical protein